jgi:hypothetical protein
VVWVGVDDSVVRMGFPAAAAAAVSAVTGGVRSLAVAVAAAALVVEVVPALAAADRQASIPKASNLTMTVVAGVCSGYHQGLMGGRTGDSDLERLGCRRGSSRVLGDGDAVVVAVGRFEKGVVGGRMGMVFVGVEEVEGRIGGIEGTSMKGEVVVVVVVPVGIGPVVGRKSIAGAFGRMVCGSGVAEMLLDREDGIAEVVETVEVGIEMALGHQPAVNLQSWSVEAKFVTVWG